MPPPHIQIAHVHDFLFHYQLVCSTICKNEHIPCAASFCFCTSISGTGCSCSRRKQWLSLLLYIHIFPLQYDRISARQYIVLSRELHLITWLGPGSLCDLEFVNHTVSHTKARTTSSHQALSRRPLSHSYQKEQLKSFRTVTLCPSSTISGNQYWGLAARPETQNSWWVSFYFMRGLWNKTQKLASLKLYFPLSASCLYYFSVSIVSLDKHD